MRYLPLAIASLLAGAVPANAQPSMVTAKNPESLVNALKIAGYEANLSTDPVGDPLIETKLEGWESYIYFYNCDEDTHDGCDSIQLYAGFDRDQPWDAAGALSLSERFRFMSVRLDETGDPFVGWDIVTGEGIPTAVFLTSVRYFTGALEDASQVVFAEDTVAETADKGAEPRSNDAQPPSI